MSFKISQAINTIVSHSSRSALNVFCNPILPKTIGNFNHKQAGKEKIRHRPSRNSGRTLRQPRLFRAVPHRGCPCAALLLNFSPARQARSIHKTDSPAVHFTGSLRRAAIFLRQHRTIAEASAVESPIRQETIGFPAHFFARAHNFKPPGRACQPEADSPMRT